MKRASVPFIYSKNIFFIRFIILDVSLLFVIYTVAKRRYRRPKLRAIIKALL